MEDSKKLVKSLRDEAISIRNKIVELMADQQTITDSAVLICKTHNLCTVCIGEGQIYDKRLASSNSGDPYHRSSDDMSVCSTCDGTGQFTNSKK